MRVIVAGVLFVFADTAAAAMKLANCVLYVVADVVAGESRYVAERQKMLSIADAV